MKRGEAAQKSMQNFFLKRQQFHHWLLVVEGELVVGRQRKRHVSLELFVQVSVVDQVLAALRSGGITVNAGPQVELLAPDSAVLEAPSQPVASRKRPVLKQGGATLGGACVQCSGRGSPAVADRGLVGALSWH